MGISLGFLQRQGWDATRSEITWEQGWDESGISPGMGLGLPLRQSQDPLGIPHQCQGHRELKVTVSPTRVASEAAREPSLSDTVGRRRQSPIVSSHRAGRRGATSTGVFFGGGRIHPPSQLYNPRAPPATGTAPAQRGNNINNINSKLGEHGGRGAPQPKGPLRFLGWKSGCSTGTAPRHSAGLQCPVLPGCPVAPGGPGMPGIPCCPTGPGGPIFP